MENKLEYSGTIHKRVMVVDDEPAFLEVMEDILLAFGCQVTPCSTVEEALQHLETESPDLILSDIMMPGINGYQFLEHLKSCPALKHIPVCLISALSRNCDIQKALEKGAAGYLSKPFTALELRDLITRSLQTD